MLRKLSVTDELRYNSVADEIIKTIRYALDRQKLKYDRTYRSVIKDITAKGYVVLDRTGSERTVKCCIPGIELRIGQGVWVKEPMGNFRNMHICGVA